MSAVDCSVGLTTEEASTALRSASAAAMVSGEVLVPTRLLTREERQQMWAVLLHAAIRVEQAASPAPEVDASAADWLLMLSAERPVGRITVTEGVYDALVLVGDERRTLAFPNLKDAQEWARIMRFVADRDPGEWVQQGGG